VILLLFGPPGCGKGSQAGFLSQQFKVPAISTGEVFRAECKAQTDLGKMACSILAQGGLVGDDIVNGIVANRILKEDCANGFLLDGYPRTVPQAMYFSSLLEQRGLGDPIVIHMAVRDELLVKRLTSRRQCTKCLRIYNLLSQPPKTEDVCDDDGAPLLTREDDREEVIRQRLRAYQELTGPILKFYGPSNVKTVDGSRSLLEVSMAIKQAVIEAASRTTA
jgi:adenylate kinase